VYAAPGPRFPARLQHQPGAAPERESRIPGRTGASPSAFGYHTGDENLSGLNPSRFSNNNSYARFETTKKEVSYSTIPVDSFSFDLVYRIEVDNQQAAGDYITDIVYVLVPTF
jgi:hypothetical protein